MKVRLSKPYLGNKTKLIALIEKILETGLLTQGKYVAQFERYVADYLGIEHAIAVSSGTAALHLSLIALGVGPNDEVIVPAYTFPATANVVELMGAKPVFVDVDLDTYNIDVNKIEKVFSSRTKAIIPVHLFGNPADMHPIIQIAKRRKIAVIEDSAGALGSQYKKTKCGSIGKLGCFSFHPRKIVTTSEGGMVVTNDSELAKKIRILRNHGMHSVRTGYNFVLPGFNYKMNELEAALGIIQMQEIRSIIVKRQSLARFYIASLKNIPEIMFQRILPYSNTVWQAFVVRFKNRRVDLVLKILRKRNIEANIGTYALHMLRFYSYKYSYKLSDYPNALELYTKGIALPFYNELSQKAVREIKNIFTRCL